jgi:calcineurin-like phosphoesterase family protein
MADFITSDIHFGHKNIMTFCPVTRARFKNDVEFILGDVAFCNAEKATGFLKRLNGTKTLVVGNHDTKLIKEQKFVDCFVEVTPYKSITIDGTKVVMFHYPIAEWDQMHRGAVHFHGHLHGGKSGLEGSRALDVGMDATGVVVSKVDALVTFALRGVIRGHHQKGE